MPIGRGFLSYVHADNLAEGNRIADLAQDVADQYRLLTTEEFRLFRDKDHLWWGEDWRERIDEELARATFFIPVITPSYFERPECRRELDLFAHRAVQRGVDALVLPVIWVDFPALRATPSGDDLIDLVRRFAWQDWTKLRFAERSSTAYRTAVADLAASLVSASEAAERVPLGSGDAPSYRDVLTRVEDTLPAWLRTIDLVHANLSEVGTLMQERAGTRQPSSFVERVGLAEVLAVALHRPVTDLGRLSTEFLTHAHEVDQGLRVVVDRANRDAAGNRELTGRVARFAHDLRTIVEEEVRDLADAEDVIAMVAEIEQGTRTLRPMARSLRRSITLLADGRDLMTTWPTILDDLPLTQDL
ncbi:toll/interleukin-1 receptor domain-containing protein [Actinophytocola gossypii]|uniref:Toll/interleukin-1 receptor domain-containing protein n=1 Tax=Actinophytocola gossypii TaxID=2812003 RepID=A0ABT2JC02_9PSEU|nr:toll/interleukin-1 receptor domain-containing protein [Actinophytocola gossypii]MCT2585389.1 toll/interleukin-1 receptor domain-containing protein [Actinophytocola gossypii]